MAHVPCVDARSAGTVSVGGAEEISWTDLSRISSEKVTPTLIRTEALARFHVQCSDGRTVSGGQAFAELWANLAELRLLGLAFRTRWTAPILEIAYRVFLPLRPYLQRLAGGRSDHPLSYPGWLQRDLRSDHAGEVGAVAIYRGVLAIARDSSLREFASRHLATEARHLNLIEAVLPKERRSYLLALWRGAGFLTGALPALFGATAVYVTIDAVESFVVRHYNDQVKRLAPYTEWRALRERLEECQRDELRHRAEARRSLTATKGCLAGAWTRLVGLGSSAAVAIARRV